MALLEKIKAALGFGSNRSADGSAETTRTVEREREAGDSAADDGGVSAPEPSADSGTDTDGSDTRETTGAGGDADEGDADEDTTAAGGDVDEETPDLDEETPAGDPVEEIKGIGPAYGERLAGMGIETVDELANADPEAVAAETSVGQTRAATWIDRANEH